MLQVLAVGDLVKAAIAEADAFGKQSKADVPAKVRLGHAAEASQQVINDATCAPWSPSVIHTNIN